MEGRNNLDNKMFILHGDEVLEQLMIWLKNYNNKTNKNVPLKIIKKLAFLKKMLTKKHRQ